MKTLPSNQLPKINQPEKIDDVLDSFYDYVRATINCHRVGIIQSFNVSTQRAVVQLVEVLRRNTYEGQENIVSAPLVDCPVFIPYGSNGGMNLPIKTGMECLVLFNDKDIQNWKRTGAVGVPQTFRMHDVTDGFCLIGFRSIPKAITNYDNQTVGISYLDKNGILQAKVKLDEKVEIANNEQNLKDLIANLISILQNLKAVNGASQYPIDPTTASNLTTLATNFNQLLK